MRCKCCNKRLSDFESTRKVEGTSEYLDMCNSCFNSSGLAAIVPIQERADLRTIEDDESDIDSVKEAYHAAWAERE